MPYVTSIERHAEERGREEGREEGIELGSTRILLPILRRICGDLPQEMQDKVQLLTLEQCENLAESVLDFQSLEDLKNWLANNPS